MANVFTKTLDTLLNRATNIAPANAKGFTVTRTMSWGEMAQKEVQRRKKQNYEDLAGNPLENSIIYGAMNWITTNFTEAPLELFQFKNDDWQLNLNTDEAFFWENPNEFYNSDILLGGLVVSLLMDGNGYIQKVRDRDTGELLQLWYIPHMYIEPHWPSDGSVFIDYYEYSPPNMLGKEPIKLYPNKDIIHLRNNITDPSNNRKGLSPMKALFREIYSDNEATRYSAAILNNMGIPGVVITPKDGPEAIEFDAKTAQKIKEKFKSATTGDQRGDAIVFNIPFDIKELGFKPMEMDLKLFHNISEERISGAIGIPAIVLGLGVGLRSSLDLKEARKLAYLGMIIPLQEQIAAQLTRQLLPDFKRNTRKFRFGFDINKVRILQDDLNVKYTAVNIAVLGGWMKVSEARRIANLPVADDGSDDVYLRKLNPDGSHAPNDFNPNPINPTGDLNGPNASDQSRRDAASQTQKVKK